MPKVFLCLVVDLPSVSCTGGGSGDDGDLHSHGLKGSFIGASPDPEVAVFTPRVAPGVLHNPVLLPCALLHAIAHHQHHMVGDLAMKKTKILNLKG